MCDFLLYYLLLINIENYLYVIMKSIRKFIGKFILVKIRLKIYI